MKPLVPALAISIALAACGDSKPIQRATPTSIVRLAAVPGRPAAGYLQLRTSGDRGALLSVSSPQASRVEMHESMMSGNMASMRPIQHIPAHDGDTITFESGGRHLMLYDVDPAVRPGGQITLVFNFERGPPEQLAAQVLSAGGGAR